MFIFNPSALDCSKKKAILQSWCWKGIVIRGILHFVFSV